MLKIDKLPAAILFVTLGVTQSPLLAELNCTIPTRERGPSVTSPALAPLRKAALAVEAIVKKDAVFVAGNRAIRIRTTIDYAYDVPRSIIVNTVAYNEGAWIKGKCDVIPEADRGGGITDGAIHIVINDPRSFLGGNIGDHEQEMFEQPPLTGTVAGFPEYNKMYVMLSDSGGPPWLPVTIADALDREERRIRKRQTEWAEPKKRPWISEAKIQQAYETLKKINPAAADEQRAAMLKVMNDEKIQRPKMEAEVDGQIAKQIEDMRTYRASFSPAHLQAQASPGGMTPQMIVRVDDPKGRKMVKIDPAYAKLDPNRVHLIRVFRTGGAQDPVPGRYAWQVKSNEGLDYAALAALLR